MTDANPKNEVNNRPSPIDWICESQTPTPVLTSHIKPINVNDAVASATVMQTHHQFGVLDSTILQILFVTQLKVTIVSH